MQQPMNPAKINPPRINPLSRRPQQKRLVLAVRGAAGTGKSHFAPRCLMRE